MNPLVKLFFFCCFLLPLTTFSIVNVDSVYNGASRFKNRGDFDKSIAAYLNACRLYEADNNDSGIVKSYIGIGLVYYQIEEYSLSRDYYQKALNVLERSPDSKLYSYVYNNLGMLAKKEQNLDSALHYYQKSLAIKQSLKDSIGISRSLTNISIIFLEKEDYRQALNYNIQSKNLKEILNDSAGLFLIYGNIANTYGLLGKLDSVEYYLNKGMLYREKGDLTLLNMYYQNFSELNRSNNNWSLALAYKDSVIAVREELFHEKFTAELSELHVQYETEKKDERIRSEQLKNEFLLDKQKNEQFRTYVLVFVIIGLIILSVLIIMVIRFRLKNVRQKTLLLEKEQVLADLKIQRAEQKQKILENEVEIQSKELISYSSLMLQKQEIIGRLEVSISKIEEKHKEDSTELIKELKSTLKSDENVQDDWDRFKKHFEQVNGSFFELLTKAYPNLSQIDHRHCAYIKIGLTTKEIATLLNITPGSVQKSRVRLKKKMELNATQDLKDFIQRMCEH